MVIRPKKYKKTGDRYMQIKTSHLAKSTQTSEFTSKTTLTS